MGLFNFNSRYDDDLAVAPGAKDGKIYKIVQLAAITVFLIAAVLLVLEIFQLLEIGSTANGIIFSIGVVGLGGVTALPWVRVFESYKKKPYRITAIVFLAVVGVCVILWIVCVWLIIELVKNGFEGATEEVIKSSVNSLNTIRVSIIISLQFIIGSYIAKNIIKYGKTLIPYQVMAGVSQLFIDFYCILVLTAITITTKGIGFSDTAVLLTNMWTHALLVIAIIIGIFPNIVFRRIDRRRLLAARKEDMKELLTEDKQPQTAAAPEANNNADNNASGATVEEKLQKIKTLLDNGLITQEEYDAKRADILNSI